MTKRTDDIALLVAADLSETSYQDAMGIITEKVISGKLYAEYPWYVLTVASQNLGMAIVMRMHENFTIDINCSYTPDEWSLTRNGVEGGKKSSMTVWSAGA